MDRSLPVGILLSVLLHALVLTILLTAVGQGRRGARPVEIASSPVVSLILLPEPQPGPGLKPDAQPALAQATITGAPAAPPGPAATPVSLPIAPPRSAAPSGGGAPAVEVAAAAPALAADPMLGEDYRRRLLDHIATYRRPPVLAEGERGTGVVVVHLALDRQGEVLSVTVSNSSGVTDLDDKAVATIWRARPMPSIPPALPGRLAVTLPVSFEPESPNLRVRGF
jgi:protein TonB